MLGVLATGAASHSIGRDAGDIHNIASHSCRASGQLQESWDADAVHEVSIKVCLNDMSAAAAGAWHRQMPLRCKNRGDLSIKPKNWQRAVLGCTHVAHIRRFSWPT